MTHAAQPYFRLNGVVDGTSISNFLSIVSADGTNWLADSAPTLSVSGITPTNAGMYNPCWTVISNQYLLCWNGASSTNEAMTGSGIGVASSQDGFHFNFIGWLVPTNHIVSPVARASANWGPHWVVDATNGLHIVFWCPTNNQSVSAFSTTNGDWILDVTPFTTRYANCRYINLPNPDVGGSYQPVFWSDPSIYYVGGIYYLLNSTYLYSSLTIDSGYLVITDAPSLGTQYAGEGMQLLHLPGGPWAMISTQSRPDRWWWKSYNLTNWTEVTQPFGGSVNGAFQSGGQQGTVIYTTMPAQ